ncbi:MAG: 4Fe-4S binding protein [Candidatus Lokiarchaeota archaeon]|nr:4Fe-4S binding protein [Candidatus Lokiarchaeota archaeon]
MEEDIYKRLQKRIDEFALGFNSTKSGVELKILQMLFTPEEAELYLHMSRELEPIEIITNKARIDASEVTRLLEQMTKKGVVFPIMAEDRKFYAAAPFMHGFIENAAVLDGPRELMTLMDEYVEGDFKARGKTLRTVPVHESVDFNNNILPFDDVLEVIKSKERIGVIPCACAKKMQIIGTNCDKSIDVCIGFDFYAEYAIEGLNVGRWITQEEAEEILRQSEREGLVHQIAGSSKSTEAICNCCPSCCNILKTIRRLPIPSKVTGSNYRAFYSLEDCVLCEKCIERCPMEAFVMQGDELSYNSDRCIGCGLCVTTCPASALSLELRDENKLRFPPQPESYQFMKSSVEFSEDVKKWIKK